MNNYDRQLLHDFKVVYSNILLLKTQAKTLKNQIKIEKLYNVMAKLAKNGCTIAAIILLKDKQVANAKEVAFYAKTNLTTEFESELLSLLANLNPNRKNLEGYLSNLISYSIMPTYNILGNNTVRKFQIKEFKKVLKAIDALPGVAELKSFQEKAVLKNLSGVDQQLLFDSCKIIANEDKFKNVIKQAGKTLYDETQASNQENILSNLFFAKNSILQKNKFADVSIQYLQQTANQPLKTLSNTNLNEF